MLEIFHYAKNTNQPNESSKMKKFLAVLLFTATCAHAQDMAILAADSSPKRPSVSIRPATSGLCFVTFGTEALNVDAIQYIRLSNDRQSIVIVSGNSHITKLAVFNSTENALESLKATVQYVENCRRRKEEENVSKAKTK